LQPTPLRVDKIGAILRVRIGENAFSIYRRGAAEWQVVGRRPIKARADSYILVVHYQQQPLDRNQRINHGKEIRDYFS
jgi:hypothetical protein